jgi:hypothetical protein
MDRRDGHARAPVLKRTSEQAADQLCQLSEVLGSGSQEELVPSARWTSQPEPVVAQNALQVREQHFDLLPFTARPDIGICFRDVARNASAFSWIERGTLRAGIFGQHRDVVHEDDIERIKASRCKLSSIERFTPSAV